MRETIGKYRLVERIGVGGFGEVYKAYDPFIKRHVAVKTCTSGDEETRHRFFREAEIAGNLHHRNITTVYDFGVERDADGELPFLIQEYLSGEDLDRKIKRHDALPLVEKADYLLQIARGLAYAHQKGVIHRDIKPSNIRILEDGTTKIMDFGIAKLARQETGLTRTGMTVGTAAYLAPEQIRGEPVDHRTDIFSFGVLAYELIAYERPFQGDQISAVIYQILNREPKPLREAAPTAPAEIEEMILRCLSKNPRDRFDDGTALLRRLETLQKRRREERPTEPTPAVSSTRETVELDASQLSPPAPERLAPSPATTRSQPVPDSGKKRLDDFELSSVNIDDSSRSRAAEVRGAAAARSPLTRYAILLILPLLALGAGWWLGDEERRGAVTRWLNDRVAPAAPGGDELDDGPDQENAGASEGEATDVAAAPVEPTPPPPPPPPTPEPAVSEPPPPPPEPQPGRLAVPKVEWTDVASFRVGKRFFPLTRDRSLSLQPGTYNVVFKVEEPDYQQSETVTVVIREGERQQVTLPIPRPGVLRVRAGLGKPQGRVTLDDVELGTSPIRGRRAPPGQHRIRVTPLSGGGESIDRQVIVHSGQETILTFDLLSGDVQATVKPPQ